MFDRARTLVLDKADQQDEIDNIKEALMQCGYPKWTFKLVEDKQKEGKSMKKKVEKEKKNLEGKERTGLAVLPYVKGLSEAAARVLIYIKKHVASPVLSNLPKPSVNICSG